MKRVLYLVLALFISATSSFAQLQGEKFVGGQNPDYETFQQAVDALNAAGVGNGGVTFSLRNGIYQGETTITAQGAENAPIIFRSESGNAADVTIQSAGSGGSVIKIEGGTHIWFEAIKVQYNFSGVSASRQAIAINSTSENITIERCRLECPNSSTFSQIYAVLYQAGASTQNLLIKQSLIKGGTYGIYFEMDTINPGENIVIEENEFDSNGRGLAMTIKNVSAPQILKNTIKVNHNSTGSTAIFIENCQGQTKITNNYIYQTLSNYELREGISLVNSSGTAEQRALIANNAIQLFSGALPAYGITQFPTSKHWDILHNTIYITGGTGSANNITRPYICRTADDDTRVLNNIFANFSTNTSQGVNQCIEIVNQSGIAALGNNCYYSGVGSNFFGSFNGTQHSIFSNFTSASGESGSININPNMVFVPNFGWKASNETLANAGIFAPEILLDIDGLPRNNPPAIGAHEFGSSCQAAAIENQPANLSLCIDSTANLTVGATGTNLQFQWQYFSSSSNEWLNATGSFFDNDQSPSLSVGNINTLQSLQMRVIVSADCGEPVTSTEVTVNVIDCSTVAGNIESFAQINIFPNPFIDQLFIHCEAENKIQTITIKSVDGKMIATYQIPFFKKNMPVELDLSALSKGVFFVEISGLQTTVVKKIIKQ